MKKLIALLLLLSAFMARAQSSAPSWFTNGTYFPPNSITTKFAAGTNVISVITADVNNDGKPDLISLTGSASPNFTSGLTVFTNNGSGILSSNTICAVSTATSVVAVDINADGWVDFVCSITNGTLNNGWLLVLTNNGSGGFVQAFTNAVGHNPSSVAAADVNGDGWVDLICANASDNTLTVLTNNGSGKFVSNGSMPGTGSAPRSLVAADINGDGSVDLICANPNGNTLSVLTNNGTGKFTSSGSPANTINQPNAVAVADVNGDGRPDLISANYGSGNQGWLTVFTNSGSGRFVLFSTLGQLQSTGTSYPYCLTFVTNFNGHGQLALVVANSGAIGGGTFSGSTLTVLTNNPTTGGIFGSNATLNVGSVPESIAVADFNGDGRPDLATANEGTNTVTVLINNSIPAYSATFTAGSYSSFTVFANGNPAPAISITNKTLPGGLTLLPTPAAILTGSTNVGAAILGGTPVIGSCGSYSLLLVATNNVYPYIATQRLSLVINQRPFFQGAAFGSNSAVNLNFYAWEPTAADVNGDGALDVVYGNNSAADALIVLTNNGSGIFGSNTAINVTLPTTGNSANIRPLNVTATDVNGDGKVDLISENGFASPTSFRSLSVLTNNGSGVFGSNALINLLSTSAGFGNGNLVAKDVNGDGRVDLIWPNPVNSSLTVFTNNGSGGFGTNATYAVGNGPWFVAAADLNGNGRVALISANIGNGSVGTLSILTNNASTNGVFGLNATINTGAAAPYSPVAADVNGNGKLALIYGKILNGTNGIVVVLTNNGSGVFGASSTNSIAGIAQSGVQIMTADVNTDGKVDLICNVYDFIGTDTLTVLTNNGSGGFGFNTSFALGSNGSDVLYADFNGDGRADLVCQSGFFTPFTLKVLTNAVPSISPALAEAGTNTFTMPASGFPLPYFSESGALPAGVMFTTNGVFTGTPSSGSPGTYRVVVTATNIFGTASQTVNLVINPAVALVTNAFSTAENTPLIFTTNNLLGNATDLDGFFPLSVTAVSATSISGGTVVLNDDLITYTYTPVNGFTGLDAFTYTAMDTNRDTAQGTVLVIVTPPGNPPYNSIATTPVAGSEFGFQFTGIPGLTYYVQSSTNVLGPYLDLPPGIVADANGLVSMTITIPAALPGEFFRVRNVP